MRRDGQPKYSQVKWLVDGVEQGAGQVFDYEVLPGQHTLTLQVKLNTMGIDRLVAGLSGAWLVEGILYLERGGEDVQATLYDSTGATLLVTSESQIDLSSFAPGVYFVRIVDRLFQVVL